MTGISDYMLTIGFCVRRSTRNSERDWSIHFSVLHTLLCGNCRSIHSLFVDFVLLFSFLHETTTKAKFMFCAKENGS